MGFIYLHLKDFYVGHVLDQNEQGGLAIIQTTALRSLFEYVMDHVNLLSDSASSSRSSTREFSERLPFQRSNNAVDPSSSLKNTGRSISLPPWDGAKNSTKMRRMYSAPRRLQAATEHLPEVVPKKGYDGNLSAKLVGLSLVLVQRGSTAVGMGTHLVLSMDYFLYQMHVVQNAIMFF